MTLIAMVVMKKSITDISYISDSLISGNTILSKSSDSLPMHWPLDSADVLTASFKRLEQKSIVIEGKILFQWCGLREEAQEIFSNFLAFGIDNDLQNFVSYIYEELGYADSYPEQATVFISQIDREIFRFATLGKRYPFENDTVCVQYFGTGFDAFKSFIESYRFSEKVVSRTDASMCVLANFISHVLAKESGDRDHYFERFRGWWEVISLLEMGFISRNTP